jgi:hypothetical protein
MRMPALRAASQRASRPAKGPKKGKKEKPEKVEVARCHLPDHHVVLPLVPLSAIKKPVPLKGRASPAVPPYLALLPLGAVPTLRVLTDATRSELDLPASPRRLRDEFARSARAGLTPVPGSLCAETRYYFPSSPDEIVSNVSDPAPSVKAGFRFRTRRAGDLERPVRPERGHRH